MHTKVIELRLPVLVMPKFMSRTIIGSNDNGFPAFHAIICKEMMQNKLYKD